MAILDFIKLPEAKDIGGLDDNLTLLLHRDIIRKKPFLKRTYIDFYRELKDLLPNDNPQLNIVELGSGAGDIKAVMPRAITSDINPLAKVDINLSVLDLPFKDGSIDAFLLLNVFHHVNKPLLCIREMNRCLKKGGKVIMIEPANTVWRRFVDKNFHHEGFDAAAGWEMSGSAPLSIANEALSWIIFCRDRPLFEAQFSCLKIKSIKLRNNFRYIISGGFTYRQLLPLCMYGAVKTIEKLTAPLNSCFGYFQTIELIKYQE